jgi:2-polyprenyl-3-methyl-5-hydroxy-6-metoxy-1,4-benzoquinol methylase
MNRVSKHINPHKDEEEIVSSLEKNYVNGEMNYENFYNEINYISPGIHIEQYLSECLKYVSNGDKWLNVGCGSGNKLKTVLQHKIKLYGMDVVDKSVENANSNGIVCIKHSAASVYPYTDEYFDMITCIDVLEHLTEKDAVEAAKQIYRTLKTKKYALLAPALSKDLTGHLHLTVKNKEWWVNLFKDQGFVFVKHINPKGILLFKK